MTVPSGSNSDRDCHCMFLCYCFVICLLSLPVVSAIFLSYRNVPRKWIWEAVRMHLMHLIGAEDIQADTFLFEVVASLWAAKPRCRVQHKERKPRAKVSKEIGPMVNDDDGQDKDWSSLIDEGGIQP